jgi:hypothetical protein
MKNKKLVLLIIGLLVIFTLNSLAETTKLKNIGKYTFARVRGKIPTQEVMKTLVDKYAADLKFGFDQAGYGDLYLPFMDQLKTATFEEKSLPVGERFSWMLFRSQGKVKVARDLEWAGKAPLDVFTFTVVKENKIYEFFIPKPCGNVALHKVEEKEVIPVPTCSLVVLPQKANLNDPITVDMGGCQYVKSMEVEVLNAQGAKVGSHVFSPDSPKWQTSFDKSGEYTFKARVFNIKGEIGGSGCEAKTYINFPPLCNLITSCLPCNDYVGRPITFDASGSTDTDGEIVKANFEILDSTGKVIDSYVAGQKPFKWDRIFTKPGVYTVIAAVNDNAGAVSPAADACKISFEITQKRLFFLAEAGPGVVRGTFTTFVGLRAGIFYWLVPDKLDFVLSGGGGLPVKGDPWRFFFMANALLNVHAGPAFIGGGLGYSTKEQVTRKSGLDIVGNVGVDIFNNYSNRGSLIFEFRSPVGGDRAFDEHYKMFLGFRMLF